MNLFLQYAVTPYVSTSVFVLGLGCRMHVYNTELHFSQYKTAPFTIHNYTKPHFSQDCTFSQNHTFSQNKTALVTIQNHTCHNTKPHLSQYKTTLVTKQSCTCHKTALFHNTRLHLSRYKTTLVTIQNCTFHKILTQKGSNECLFILTPTHSMQISGVIPLYQATKQHLNNR